MSRERRRELTIPELKQDQGQPAIGEERFQYLLQLLTTYENNNIQRMKAVLDELAVYKNGMTTLSQTFLRMEREIAHIMKLVGYYDDPDTGEFKRPVIPERTEGKLAI